MLSDIEIWRAANQLIERYGDCAKYQAAQRADAMLQNGDMEGLAVWKRILAAVSELQITERPAGIKFTERQNCAAQAISV